MRRAGIVALFLLGSSGGAWAGDIVSDGDFDALAVGTPPNCDAFAGAWGWPQIYIDNLLCETVATNYRIVATGSFDTGAEGNSLQHIVNDQTLAANFHLPNIWNQTISEADGVIVTVTFDIWVDVVDVSGGHIYVGGDHGGGGFSNLSDRGPQLTWYDDGMLAANEFGGVDDLGNALPPIRVDLAPYTIDTWQSVRLEIDLANDTFDVFHGPRGGELVLIGDDILFRVELMDHVDRFTVAHFGAILFRDQAYIDNLAVCTVDCGGEPPVCEGDANGDNIVDPLDSGYVLSRFGCDVGLPDCAAADQNGDGVVDPLDAGFVLSRFGECPAGLLNAPVVIDTIGSALEYQGEGLAASF